MGRDIKHNEQNKNRDREGKRKKRIKAKENISTSVWDQDAC